VRGTLLVAGTGSDAGKSVLVAGLCRWLSRQGVKVAPFKAQNMSLNSFVTLDGAEIGRAQAMQAAAAGIEPAADMNPVLLKPGSDRRSQVVVLGHPEAEADAVGYRAHAPRLRQVALDSLARLQSSGKNVRKPMTNLFKAVKKYNFTLLQALDKAPEDARTNIQSAWCC
jgi:adenosylcobyric acid synthase